MEQKGCCFFGHRKIKNKDLLKNKLLQITEKLIVCENIKTFYLGSKSEFDDLCREVLTEQKEKYSHIDRVYIRAEFQYINDTYEKYLLANCDRTYYPEKLENAGKAVYVERNNEMIDKSTHCVCYFIDAYAPPKRKNSKKDFKSYQPKSGTATAYNYAVKKNKIIINLAE